MVLRALVAFALLAAPGWAGQAPPPDSLAGLVTELEAAGAEGNSAAILALGISPDAPGLRAFAEDFRTAPARFVIKERDRGQLPSGGDRLLLEVFAETNNEAVISTWRADVVDSGAAPGAHRIAELERLTVVNGLYRLSLNPAKQFTVQNLTVEAPDLTLELPKGQAFVAEIAEGPTAVVLLGRGRLRFAPSNAAERTQVRIFGGEETLDAEFDAVLVRVRPAEFEGTFASASLIPSTVVPGDFRRAVGLFDDLIGQSLSLDLTDLSRDRWSLVPSPRDLIVEIRTRRMGQLTYARSTRDPEDISFFDRRRRRNIAVYASEQKLASRGRFYSEDDTADYDVLRYDVDVSFAPHRMWVSGNARVKIRIRAYALTAITLRLAEPLAVRGILSPEYGRLLHLRVVGQNSVIVNFPTSVLRDTELWLHVVYGGRLEPQQIDREGITVTQQQQQVQEQIYIPIEPHYLYSNRSYWYPQSPVTDYATAHLRVTVPPDLDVVATGIQAGPPAPAPGPVEPGERPDKLFVFSADSPVRYLACIISRFEGVVSRSLPAPSPGTGIAAAFNKASGPSDADARQSDDLPVAEPAGQATILTVVANPRQGGRARSLADRAASIMQYYTTLIGDAPYPAFTLAVTEHELPGGHSPGYFALLNQPPALSPLVWRNDPVAFDGYAPYFLAHEIAHQWWGQAVGWKNYHEQWLSEAFAQYFAVLYGSADRGTDLQTSMLRQMRRWAMQESDEGPVYLGYRLGHIRGDSRVFRAVLYNKGAMVLHMLRRLVGDGCFFGGLRVFYRDWRFKKAGTDDFRLAVESVCGGDLSAFFEAWIYGTDVPRLRFSSTVNGSQATVRFEHQGTVMPVPVTVTVLYQDGGSDEVVVPVTERSIERRLPLRGAVRSIEANRDHAAVAEIDR
jgi:hypothetical protein